MLEKISLSILPIMILLIMTAGLVKRVPVYEEFVEGAKDGFKVSVSIIPYLVALIVAVSMLRASGVFDWFTTAFGLVLNKLSLPADIVPIIFTRPLSGSAALGLFSEIGTQYGPDAFITKLSAIMIGSSETTFYVLSVYFGSVGIKKFRYALLTGVLADVVSIVLAILVARAFFLANCSM